MLEKRLLVLKPNVSDRTIKTYATNIRRLRKIDENLAYQPISAYLKTLKPSLASNLLTSVIVLEGNERFGKLYQTLNKLTEEQRYNQEFTNRELDSWSTVRQIRDGVRRARFDVDRLELLKAKKHKSTHLQILTSYMLLRLYSEFHWRADIVSVRLGKVTGHNYFYMGKFYLNSFKTSKKFKARGLLPLVFTPSPSLAKLIRQYLDVRKAQNLDHDYFLFNKSRRPVQRSAFYDLMTRTTFKYIGKKLSVSMLRHIYITEFLAGNQSLADKQKKLRGFMQLSLDTFESYGRRGPDGRLVTGPGGL